MTERDQAMDASGRDWQATLAPLPPHHPSDFRAQAQAAEKHPASAAEAAEWLLSELRGHSAERSEAWAAARQAENLADVRADRRLSAWVWAGGLAIALISLIIFAGAAEGSLFRFRIPAPRVTLAFVASVVAAIALARLAAGAKAARQATIDEAHNLVDRDEMELVLKLTHKHPALREAISEWSARGIVIRKSELNRIQWTAQAIDAAALYREFAQVSRMPGIVVT